MPSASRVLQERYAVTCVSRRYVGPPYKDIHLIVAISFLIVVEGLASVVWDPVICIRLNEYSTVWNHECLHRTDRGYFRIPSP